MKQLRSKNVLWLICLTLLGLSSCRDYMAEYYERPDWIKGNCYEVLEKDGHYSTFLKGIELAGFRDMVDGKSILTVMAPNDEAFAQYLQAKGLNSIEEMDSVELDKLIGFHLMYYAYSADKLNNFRPQEGDDVSDEEKRVNAGMYYKHRTKSKDANTTEYYQTIQQDVTIYHHERFLPVFSQNYFNTKQIDAEENYRYFFPNTEWNPTGIGYNVAGAAVTKGNQITSNGYVHEIDRVLEPVNTIYSELKRDSNFTMFLDLYKKYEYFAYNPTLSLEYGNGERLYEHLFLDPMPQIACEWPSTDYSQLTTLSSVGYTIFAPTNDALNNFFNNYWAKGGYASLSNVSGESIKKLLFNCVYKGKSEDGKNYDGNIAFPEEIRRGDVINSYGSPISLDLDRVPEKYRILCQNGLLYGCEDLAVPAMFAAVTGPAYQYKHYGFFLEMLAGLGDMESMLYGTDMNFIALMPNDDQFKAAGYKQVSQSGRTYIAIDGKEVSAGVKSENSYAHFIDLANCTGSANELDSLAQGTQVFRTFSPDYTFYIYLKDGKICNSYSFNQLIYPTAKTEEEIFAPFHELKSYTEDGNWSNGKAYAYEGDLMPSTAGKTTYKSFQGMMKNNIVNAELPYYGFVNLLEMAGMYNEASFNFVQEGELQMMLVPTNEAVFAAIKDSIPGLYFDKASYVEGDDVFAHCSVNNDSIMQMYMKQYFVPMSSAGVSNYPYLGWKEDTSKGMTTLNSVEIVDPVTSKVSYDAVKLVITDKGDKLSVKLLEDNAKEIDFCGDYHYFPFVFEDGCVQFINEMF
ncbi:MAG: fasciclin domain-containing protein [Bacteroidales bacterium]|nr:fasciclin domain-containing protein [Bacteroidales bacterium]